MGKALASVGQLPPWTPSRRPAAIIRARIKQSGQRIGDLVLAWNAAHEGVFEVMRLVLCGGDFQRAKDMWIALENDGPRRKVLQAAAHTFLAKRRTLLTALKWTLRRIDALAEVRNDAVHIHLMNWGGEALPHFLMTKDGALKRYDERPWEAEVAEVCGDLRALGDYAKGIAMALQLPSRPRPYYRRPALRSSVSLAVAANEKRSRQRAGGGHK